MGSQEEHAAFERFLDASALAGIVTPFEGPLALLTYGSEIDGRWLLTHPQCQRPLSFRDPAHAFVGQIICRPCVVTLVASREPIVVNDLCRSCFQPHEGVRCGVCSTLYCCITPSGTQGDGCAAVLHHHHGRFLSVSSQPLPPAWYIIGCYGSALIDMEIYRFVAPPSEALQNSGKEHDTICDACIQRLIDDDAIVLVREQDFDSAFGADGLAMLDKDAEPDDDVA